MSLGHSGSTSSSAQTTSSYQMTASGGSGANSPTVIGGGDVTVTDAGQTAHAIDAVMQLANSGLGLLGDFNAREAQAQVAQTRDSVDLLSSVLANNQTLAQNVQSGGATVGMNLTNKIVWGVLALAGVVIALFMFRK